MASAKEIALLERKLKSAKTNREKIVLAKELKDLKSKLTTTQKKESLPTQRRKIRMLSSAEFNELIARLKQKPEYSFLKSMGKKKIEDDYRVVGKPVGWRIKGKDNYKVPSKRFRQENPDLVYFENRINRSDVHRPNRLEHGGNLYKLKDGENVWYLTYLDSTHFFLSNSEDFKGNPYHIGQFRGRPFYDEVDEWLKSETRKRHSYETGGSISKGGMMHFVLNEMSNGFIANHSNADNYAETSRIRNKMIQILKKDGDSKYSLSKAVALVKKAETSSKYETGGSLKKKNLVEYVVPNWSVPCLINGDFSGLSDEDEKSLDEFTERVKNECGNAMFMLGEKSDDYGFSHSNDVDNYAGDVTTLYINPDNSYARGGGLKKKGKSQPAVTSNAVQPKYSDYNVQLVESQDENNKGTYYMFPKPADKNSKGILFEKGGEIKVGDWVAEKKGVARGKVYEDTGWFIKLEDKYGNKSNSLYFKGNFKRSVKPRY